MLELFLVEMLAVLWTAATWIGMLMSNFLNNKNIQLIDFVDLCIHALLFFSSSHPVSLC